MYKNLREYENSNYFSPMKCHKGLIILLFFISFTQLFAQGVKRKFRGVYEGSIPAYEVKMGKSTFAVKSSEIKLFLDRDSLFIEIGSYRYGSDYSVEKEENRFILTSSRENSGIPEQLFLDPRSKTVIRKGLAPQPDATLNRKGKLPRR
jgi:hypothetical protein